MKVNRKVVLLIILTTVFTGCKKWIIDYRNKWVGDYSFTWTEWYWDGSAWVSSTHQTNGRVLYRPLSHRKKYLTIDVSDGVVFEPDVDKSGKLNEDCDKFLNGTISGNNISFTGASKGNCDDSKGPTTSYTVTGTKK